MGLKDVAACLVVANVMIFSGAVSAQQQGDQTPGIVRLYEPQPYELRRNTFINLTLQSVDPDRVSAMVYQNVYDNFENIVIPKGSRVFGRQVSKTNDVHNVYWTEIQLSSTGQTYVFEPPLQATTPLGAAGITDFKPAATVGTLLRTDIVFPH